jgi:hypothetical protein
LIYFVRLYKLILILQQCWILAFTQFGKQTMTVLVKPLYKLHYGV